MIMQDLQLKHVRQANLISAAHFKQRETQKEGNTLK